MCPPLWLITIGRNIHFDGSNMTRLILNLAVVFGSQGALACLFYRSRVVLQAGFHPSWTDSDFTVFGLPLVIGFALAALVLFSSLSQLPASKRVFCWHGDSL